MEDLFPVLPFRAELYTPGELFAGFSIGDPESYARTTDFRAYRSTLLDPNRDVGMLRALHDQSVSDHRDALLQGRRVVAIMGGHAMSRRDDAYRQVAEMARSLARSGFLVVSGGGPGAMEATHLGALLAPSGDLALTEAIGHLCSVPDFPAASKLVAPGGAINLELLRELHAWQVPAFELLDELPEAGRGESLSVPTWFYGHEPPTPFATQVAKYFSNPLREDGLLSIAMDGIVYAPGRAGTVQEIFQDAVQNVYRVLAGRSSPMAFLDTDACWTRTLPVLPILRELLGHEDFSASVAVSDDPSVLLAFLER